MLILWIILTLQIFASQLSRDIAELNFQLDQIFTTANHWKALLFLNEAEVFLTQQFIKHIDWNRLVTIFLHKFEYFQNILFLTTNQLSNLNEIIKNRAHLLLTYSDLNHNTKKKTFQQFLQKDSDLAVHVDDQKLIALTQITLNEKQINEIIAWLNKLVWFIWSNKKYNVYRLHDDDKRWRDEVWLYSKSTDCEQV